MAAKLPQGGRGHICDSCARTDKYQITWGAPRQVKVELKGQFGANKK